MRINLRSIGSAVLLFAWSLAVWADNCTNIKEFVPATTPLEDFDITTEGTAIHRKTGLEWMRCSVGQSWNGSTCTGEAEVFSWRLAVKAGEESNFANHTDWRLPDRDELASIIEQRCFSPAVNEAIFPNTSSNWYWSSTLDPHYSFVAWYITFYNGRADSGFRTDSNGRVRLVRGAPLVTAGP